MIGFSKPVPESVFNSSIRSKLVKKRVDSQYEIAQAIFDLELHSKSEESEIDSVEIFNRVSEKHSPFRTGIEEFGDEAKVWPFVWSGHLQEYPSTYFSYSVANAISSRFFNKYFDSDPLSQEGGDKLRSILSKGNSEIPRDLITYTLDDMEFFSPSNLADALVNQTTYELE